MKQMKIDGRGMKRVSKEYFHYLYRYYHLDSPCKGSDLAATELTHFEYGVKAVIGRDNFRETLEEEKWAYIQRMRKAEENRKLSREEQIKKALAVPGA